MLSGQMTPLLTRDQRHAVSIKQRSRVVPRLFVGSTLIIIASLLIPSIAHPQSQPQENQTLQSRQPQQSPPQPPPSKPDPATESQQQGTSPKNDRLFGVLPNYLTVEDEDKVPPLTTGGKFKLVSKNAFDPAIFPFIGFIALVSQAQNSEPEYGQGAAGFAKRYGAAFGDATIATFMTGAVFPSLFKQDPRYYQLVHGGFKRRLVYSVGRILITRTDSGHSQFNSSEIVGNFFAAGIANAYHPAQDRSFVNTVSVWGTDTGWDTMANIAQEF